MNKVNLILCKFCLVTLLITTGTASAGKFTITGAGASFPYPLYAKWAAAYKAQTGTIVNYQSIGSGGGIKQIIANTIDFGASDMPMKPEELKKNGLMQFPVVIGGVVPIVNLAGIEPGTLKMDGKTLANIYLGKITKWNDPQIAANNKDLKLPDEEIIVVHRSEGSATTYIFTDYLSKVSPEWKSTVGKNTSLKWPLGTGVKGSEGVSTYVKLIKGSIGYVEYAYALQNKLNHLQLKNHDGYFIQPDSESFKAAAAGVNWEQAPDFYELLTDEAGKNSWPICGATFILMRKMQEKPDTAREILNFFNWAYTIGGKTAESLDYVSMPDSVVKSITTAWSANITDMEGVAIWK
jgi:phosphate transport system substrate-binding protein